MQKSIKVAIFVSVITVTFFFVFTFFLHTDRLFKLNKKYIKRLKKSGLLVHTYTVNKEEDFKRMKWGVTGIFMNFPENNVMKRIAPT